VGRGAVPVVTVDGIEAIGIDEAIEEIEEARMVVDGEAVVGTETAEVTDGATMDEDEEAVACANTPPDSDAEIEGADETPVWKGFTMIDVAVAEDAAYPLILVGIPNGMENEPLGMEILGTEYAEVATEAADETTELMTELALATAELTALEPDDADEPSSVPIVAESQALVPVYHPVRRLATSVA